MKSKPLKERHFRSGWKPMIGDGGGRMKTKESLCKRCAVNDCGPRIGLRIIMESDIVIECSDYIPR